MSSPHDHFIKGFLSSPPEARDFLETYLPASIMGLLQLENLELTKESFIGTQHEESRTDLLYKIPLNRGSNVFVYLLFEHKSYYDPNIFFQLLEYLSKIYTWQKQNSDSLSIVIPFVFYHGEKEWNLGQSFLDSFPKDTISGELLNFIPNFSIQLMELKRKDNTFPTKNLALRLYLKMIQIIRDDPEKFLENIKEIYSAIREESNEAKRVYILRNLLEYLFRARTDAEKYTEKNIIQAIGGEYMNLLQKIKEEGKLEGILEGRQVGKLEGKLEGELKGKLEGILEGKLETARNLLNNGFGLGQVLKVTGLSKKDLEDGRVI